MMAGIPNWTTDIGGFFRDEVSLNPVFKEQYTNEEFIELLTRWFQFGAFNPVFRIHGYKSETEIWRYGPQFEAIAKKFINIRYQFIPYIYSQAYKIHTEGGLLMSPLAYQYGADPNTWNVDDQFLLGTSVLVCPVTEYKATNRNVYLPEGSWYNYWSNEVLDGKQTIEVPSPIDEIPLFIKSGAILPISPEVQYATEETDEPMEIWVYAGTDGSYTLYMDDNVSNEYRKGLYNVIEFQYTDADSKLTIKNTGGSLRDFKTDALELKIKNIAKDKYFEVVFDGNDLVVNL